ncbi:hypothetical protein E3Q17_00349 [Wallemia mellicola]|uniref:C3H1-type domain-containing protein n=1 Tax=Wallemia mellicola TaxID=1708541 RepID=A0A4T0P319_9BASI|nr:hypothetical protein E3Q17_00349 [Wallemia mellicola]
MSSDEKRDTRKELEIRIAELNCHTSKQEHPEGAQKPIFSYSHSSSRGKYPKAYQKPSYRPRHMNMNMSLTNANSADSSQPASWVSRRTGNMSLVTSDTLEKSLSLKAAKEKEIATKKAQRLARKSSKRKKHQSITKDGRRQIIIDGVPFEFDETGGKLVKVAKEDNDTFNDEPQQSVDNIMDDDTNNNNNTPKKMTIDGTNYVRTKSGNLVRDIFAKKRNEEAMKAKQHRLDKMVGMLGSVQRARNTQIQRKPHNKKEVLSEDQKISFGRKRCPTFTKSGRCSKALHCPYVHDSSKTAICPHFLRKKCRNSDSSCPLSHTPSPNNMPNCSHFESPNGCRAGDECLFTHVHLSKDASVCRDFAVLGFCDKGLDCDSKHVRECPDYAENGECKNPSCNLPHILKSEANKVGVIDEFTKRKEVEEESQEEQDESSKPTFKRRKNQHDDLTEQSDFVTFDDSGNSSDSADSVDSDQESVNSDDYNLANESIPLY